MVGQSSKSEPDDSTKGKENHNFTRVSEGKLILIIYLKILKKNYEILYNLVSKHDEKRKENLGFIKASEGKMQKLIFDFIILIKKI